MRSLGELAKLPQGREEFADLNAQDLGDLHQIQSRYVSFPPLNPAVIGTAKPGLGREGFLGKAFGLSNGPDLCAQRYQKGVLAHGPKVSVLSR